MEPKALFGIVVMFVVAIFGLAIGADIVREVQTEKSETISVGDYFKNISVTVTGTMDENITVGSAHAALHEKCAFTLASCVLYNSSNNFIIPSSNYSVYNPSDCRIFLLLNDTLHNESAKKLSCPYTAIGGMMYNVSLQGQQALEDFSDWTPTLALVIAAIMVIAVLIGFVATRMR